ncbi:hypothetical protein [Microbacterium sp. P02]|uniref:hypothetical protein n=1 Tax=Microbacterium sp. P02 TaxID=3366260 RepID=UPI00366DF5B7
MLLSSVVTACALLLVGCAPAGDVDAVDAAASASPSPTASAPGESPAAEADPPATPIADGPADPAQTTRRTGPIAEYGGPPYGLQGDPEPVGEGAWCATVGLFWGDPGAPEDVTFRLTGTISVPVDALTAGTTGCGSIAPDQPCLGFTMSADTPFTACSLPLTETAAFAGSAEVTFTGTLECSEPRFCDAAQARSADPGPPIVITSASTPDEGE